MSEPAKVVDITSVGRSLTEVPTPELRTAASVLLERLQFMRQAGMSFKGLRDLYEILGYERVLTAYNYRERYRRGGIAKRIVEAFPNACWRGGLELIEDEDPKVSTPLEKAWRRLNKKLKVTSMLRRADILAGQGRYAVLLIGEGKDLDQELKKGTGKPDKLLYLTPFSEEDALIQKWETDVSNPRFGLPTEYMLRRTAASAANAPSYGLPPFSSTAFNKPVHWSRVIHVAEGCLDNDVFGAPTLEPVWNLLDDLDKVTGGGAEAFWLRANQGVQLDVDKDMTLSPDEKENLRNQAEEYQHQIRRMLRTRGVKVNTLGSDVANFSNPADAILTQIAGTKAIPKRILTGSEMGELASSQDRDNWKDQINGRQTEYCGPNMVRPLIDRLIEYKYLPEPSTKKDGDDEDADLDYDVKWPHIQVLTEQEKATGAKDWAATATAEGPVFTRDEIRDKWYDMEPLPKPDLDPETGVHTAPGSGLEVDVQVDPETGLPLKKAEPTIATDPETGLPVEVNTEFGVPAHTIGEESGEPEGAVEEPEEGLPPLLLKTAGGRGSNQYKEKGTGKVYAKAGPRQPGQDDKGGDGAGRDDIALAHVGKSGDASDIMWAQPLDHNGRPIPIKVKDIAEAAKLVLAGKVVELPDVKGASTLINELSKMALEAQAKGGDAPNYDLCNVSVGGTNLFCSESVRSKEFPQGIPRIKMPQMSGKAVPGSDADKLPKNEKGEVKGGEAFLKSLEEAGIKTSKETVKSATLKASQREMIGPQIAAMMDGDKAKPFLDKLTIYVSKDNYVVDGHHTWAASVGKDAADGKLGDTTMNVVRIDMPISEVLHRANVWSAKFGIQQKAAAGKKPKEPKAAQEFDEVEEAFIRALEEAIRNGDAAAVTRIIGIQES